MNQFIEVNGKVINKNNITQVFISPTCKVSDVFVYSEIVIFYIQGREVLKEEIEIAIEPYVDNCKETKGTPCYKGEKDGSDCSGCKIIKDLNKAAKIICRGKLIEQFDNIKEILGVDEIRDVNCLGSMSFSEDGKLYWKEG
ncbi:MAG: hypothetical protein K0R54_6033 [Clostridiaceae bacterium]|jgi:hypothetical protein|nr:hypothetical protein [Clostridiaceae bacterium]